MLRSLAFSLLLLPLGLRNLAAQDAPRSPERDRDAMLRQLVARVESLEAEVRQLRAAKKAQTSEHPAAAKSELASIMDSMPATESDSMNPELATAQETYPNLKIRGFGDVDYHWADRGADKNAFRLGQVDLFLTSQLAEDLSVMDENVIEADEDNHFGFEIERLMLQWTPRDYFNVAVGRYHTAIGYYNMRIIMAPGSRQRSAGHALSPSRMTAEYWRSITSG
jgi:hypothetical protein